MPLAYRDFHAVGAVSQQSSIAAHFARLDAIPHSAGASLPGRIEAARGAMGVSDYRLEALSDSALTAEAYLAQPTSTHAMSSAPGYRR